MCILCRNNVSIYPMLILHLFCCSQCPLHCQTPLDHITQFHVLLESLMIVFPCLCKIRVYTHHCCLYTIMLQLIMHYSLSTIYDRSRVEIYTMLTQHVRFHKDGCVSSYKVSSLLYSLP